MNYNKLLLLIGFVLLLSSTVLAQNFKYVGANSCKMCHNKPEKGEPFTKWESGPHAKAMESLVGDEASDPKCLKCHSTAASVDANLITTLKVEEGVSCESCHGPGSMYKTAIIMRNQKLALSRGLILPEESVCKKCHNEESPHYKGFNFDEYWAQISHDDPTTEE